MELAPGADDVLRKIGRNLLLFQQIEGLLKFIVANSKILAPASDLPAAQERQAAKVHKLTMGELVGKFSDDVMGGTGAAEEPGVEIDEAWYSFSFKVSADSAFVDQQNSAMANVVSERNELIHHFLAKWNPASQDSTLAIIASLDAQRDKAVMVREQLRAFAKSLQDNRKSIAEFLASGEGERQMELAWLRNSRLVALLGDVAMQRARPDGWTSLALAGQLVKLHEPAEMTEREERFGYSTLKGLLQATEMFDVMDEPTPKGGNRTLYRLKPEWKLRIGGAAAES